MQLTLLWTDYFVYLLVAMALWLAFYSFGHQHMRERWAKVVKRPLNLIAVMILIFYCLLGVLDSVHFEVRRPNEAGSSGIVSVLDTMLQPMRIRTERSYSAPFAIQGYTKETITLANGTIIRDYPLLIHGGAHLKNGQSKAADIRDKLLRILLQSMILWSAISILLLALAAHRQQIMFESFLGKMWIGNSAFPWRTFLLTLGFFIFCCVFVADFMPSYHIFGTDQVGEDVLYQSLKSIRTGLVIGTLTTIVMLPFAILFGMMAGYFRGMIDDIIQYTYTTLSSIPGVLLIAAAVLTLQIVMDRNTDLFQNMTMRADARLLALCAILGLTSWTELCRYIRGETLKITQMDFVLAAYSLAVSHSQILLKHLLPNVTHIILITIALNFSGLVLAEAVLSYVGVGVDPNTYSWGMMINSARMELARVPIVWWSLSAAFIFMFMLVLAANIFSDALRDAFDPQSQLARGK